MYTLGNLGVRRVQDVSAKRMVGRRKIFREIWEKHVFMSFHKCTNRTCPSNSCNFVRFSKTRMFS